MCAVAAFLLLQNRTRTIAVQSVWVLAVIFTGGIGLLLMLARTVYLERRQAMLLVASSASGR